MRESKIEWTHSTFNPWWGCEKVSPGCTHCYAEAFAKRVGQKVWGGTSPRRFFGDKHWNEPLKWNAAAAKSGEPWRVFCSSMADVFEDRDDLRDERARLFSLIRATPNLTWLLLTKRPENIMQMVWPVGGAWHLAPMQPNVWFGTTTEDQQRANERIPLLLQTPAAVRFLSVEPLLGPVDLFNVSAKAHPVGAGWFSALHRTASTPAIDWVIVGGESGGGRRPMEVAWVESIAAQCETAGVPLYVKQDAGQRPGQQGRLPDHLWAHKSFPKSEAV